jgi:hypothetical protein
MRWALPQRPPEALSWPRANHTSLEESALLAIPISNRQYNPFLTYIVIQVSCCFWASLSIPGLQTRNKLLHECVWHFAFIIPTNCIKRKTPEIQVLSYILDESNSTFMKKHTNLTYRALTYLLVLWRPFFSWLIIWHCSFYLHTFSKYMIC